MITGFANYLQVEGGKILKQVMITETREPAIIGSTEAILGKHGKPQNLAPPIFLEC